ncbi:MAG: hypothetical protein WC483_00005, partial [Candidatus Paceibacterota bacterium]
GEDHPRTTVWPGRGEEEYDRHYERFLRRSSFRPEADDEESASHMMFLSKRSYQPFKTVFVGGFEYGVEDSGDPSADEEIAMTLHELNSFAIDLIGYIGRYIDAVDEGRSAAGQFDVDMPHLRQMYENLRRRYTVDAVFEAAKGSGEDSSYVINLGEEVHMCVRSGDSRDKMVVLYTVMTHELAHVASTTPDHDEEFWDNYAVLREIVVQMGVVRASEIPADGGMHCQKIRISKGEMMGIASPYSPSRLRVDSPYVPTSLPLRMRRSEDFMSERTSPKEAASLMNPFYVQNRSPFVAGPYQGHTEGEVGMGESTAKDVLGEFDWRYGTPEREQPGVYCSDDPSRECGHVMLGNSGQYSRRARVMGRHNVGYGESLHSSLDVQSTYSHWSI